MGPVEFKDIQRNSVVISWKPSESDGGSPLTGYTLEIRESSKTSWSPMAIVKPDITSYCVQKLKERLEYFFRIFAENKVGKSDALVSEGVTVKSPFGKYQHSIISR